MNSPHKTSEVQLKTVMINKTCLLYIKYFSKITECFKSPLMLRGTLPFIVKVGGALNHQMPTVQRDYFISASSAALQLRKSAELVYSQLHSAGTGCLRSAPRSLQTALVKFQHHVCESSLSPRD